MEKIVPEPFVEHPKSGVFHVAGSGLTIKIISGYLSPELVPFKIWQIGVNVQDASWRETEMVAQFSPRKHLAQLCPKSLSIPPSGKLSQIQYPYLFLVAG